MILYKYFSPERTEVLKNHSFRFTQPFLLNDLFESLPVVDHVNFWPLDLVWDEGVTESYYELKSAGVVEETLEEFTRAKSALKEDSLKDFINDKILSALCKSGVGLWFAQFGAGVICLTEKPDNLLMWSHYAAEHKGFVMGFDVSDNWLSSANQNNPQLGILKKIQYRSNRPLDSIESLFFKSEDWSYEQEWRMILPLHECEMAHKRIFTKKFPIESVESLVLGCRMEKSKRVEILELCSFFPNLKLYKSFPDSKSYKMQIIPSDKGYHLPDLNALS